MPKKQHYPIRKIMEVISVHPNFPYGRNRVLLECGHEILSNGQYRAHCHKCAGISIVHELALKARKGGAETISQKSETDIHPVPRTFRE